MFRIIAIISDWYFRRLAQATIDIQKKKNEESQRCITAFSNKRVERKSIVNL